MSTTGGAPLGRGGSGCDAQMCRSFRDEGTNKTEMSLKAADADGCLIRSPRYVRPRTGKSSASDSEHAWSKPTPSAALSCKNKRRR